jgi:hypothetical protein
MTVSVMPGVVARLLTGPGLGSDFVLIEPAGNFVWIEANGAEQSVVRNLALLSQTVNMLDGPACNFRNDLGGDKLRQAWVRFYVELILRFQICIPCVRDCRVPTRKPGVEKSFGYSGVRWNKVNPLGRNVGRVESALFRHLLRSNRATEQAVFRPLRS